MPRGDGFPKTSKAVTLAAIFIVVVALHLMREVLIPLALAVLFSFLLAPIVNRLERLKLGRIGSVLIVAIAAFALIGGLGYIVTGQVVNLARNLNDYSENIVAKLESLRPGKDSVIEDVAETFEEVQKKLDEPAPTQTTQPADVIADEIAARTGEPRVKAEADIQHPPEPPPPATQATTPLARSVLEAIGLAGGPWTEENPFPTAVVEPRLSPMQQLGHYVGLVLGPLGTAGLVIIFVIFMLFQRRDLRDRLIRLIGQGQLNLTTQALDDTAQRISRYLMAQAIINGTYGLAISIGLYLIGATLGDRPFPNVILWGVLCAILRFIPYIGPWIAASLPIAVSFAVYKGSGVFIATCVYFVIIELLSNNLMEPWLYGSSTGMSAIAVLVSAVFWTFLWGPVGLLLATPMTVCVVVLGKYVPQLHFLDIMLGDEPVLSPPERVYQRLLAQDEEEATSLVHDFLDDHSLEEVYDEILMPALGMAEQDRHRGRLDEQRQRFIRSAMKNMIDELGDRERLRSEESARKARDAEAGGKSPPREASASASSGAVAGGESNGSASPGTSGAPPATDKGNGQLPRNCTINAVCLPAHDEADEIVGLMLSQLLAMRGYCTTAASVTRLAGEMVEMIEQHAAHVVCVSAMPPAAVTHSRYLCKRIHVKYPDMKMVVGLWTYRGDMKKAKDRITCVGSVQVVVTLSEALQQIHQIVQPLLLRAEESSPNPPAHA